MGKTHLIRALRVFADSGTLIDEFATTYARVATSGERRVRPAIPVLAARD
jgi:hypothetical protein